VAAGRRPALDGATGLVPPSQLQIDQHCIIRNYPASNPIRTNFSFFTQPGQTSERWVVIFDNVVHTGQMSCNAVHEHKIWFVNGSSSSIQQGCQNLLIPVEKIVKDVPAGQTTAAIGVPFTYTLTIPVLFDPATQTVIDDFGSPNDLHSVSIFDDLNETGVDLTYLSHTLTWESSGAPVPHTFANTGGLLNFEIAPIIPADAQILLTITAVLEDTPTNAPGTQFVNIARWDFGRLIDGEFFEPLPGESGISPPLTIAGPELVVTKTGPATLGRTLNLGEWGNFTIDAENTGLADAWDVTIRDLLPDGPTGGMCDLTPELLGVTLAGAPLGQGTDYTLAWAGAPGCELTLTLLDAAGPIAPGERLVIDYRTKLDADSQDGVALTNVAGATEWFNDASSNPSRVTFTRILTDGTPGVADHEDEHTVTVALRGFFFEKTVANLTSGANPTATAEPGHVLRYTLRLQSTEVPLDDVAFRDDLGALNASPVFVPGSLTLVSVPPGADASGTDPNGGTNGAGLLDVRGIDVPVSSEASVVFDITVQTGLLDGTVILNQADLMSAGVTIAVSDDPNLGGQADPNVDGDEDPTRVVIARTPPNPALKENTQATASIGETFSYRITIPETPYIHPMVDVRIVDDLSASAADLRFVSVTRISGPGSWTPTNTGTDTQLVIEDPTGGIDIPAGEQIVVEIAVVLEDTLTNVAGLVFTNTVDYTFDANDGDPASQLPGLPGTSPPMTVVEPELTLQKSGPATMTIGTPGTFTLDVQNAGDGPAWNATVTDRLPDTASGGTCETAPTAVVAQVFAADGTTPVSGVLAEGTDYSLAWSGAPGCLLTLRVLSAAGTIGPSERLLVTYDAQLDADTQDGAALTNVAGAIEWFSWDASSSDRRTYTEVVTDGTVGVLDHEDAHTVTVIRPVYRFEKTVANLTSGADPATTATPGDRLRYRIVIENQGSEPLDALGLVDELDRLNTPAAFVPGTLQLVTVPAGADPSGTSATGGAQGTGRLDVQGIDVPPGASVLVELEITLVPVLPNGTIVANQSELSINGTPFALSDDPNVNGPADPLVAGDEDPTTLSIVSAPAFQVEKVSADVTGDPSTLLPGDTLRYTITVKNVGTADAVDAELRDAVPANTSYVAGSTTLNGSAVPDGPGGSAPLAAGIPIWAPEDPTPGAMRADASATTSNVATLVFDVVVDPAATNGTVISNQAFVSAVQGGVTDQPSDDPRTPTPDDPTIDVVGDTPDLFTAKSAALLVDAGSPGVVDPGDTLQYTITVTNSGALPATGVVLTDGVPANTSYVPGTTTLNGTAVPDGGGFPLAAGLPISSSDGTPPLPGAGAGTINPGQTATVTFELQVNLGVPGGTLITNQAVTGSNELPDLLSDGDGNPATGPEPTVVLVGDGQQLLITKQVAVVGGGPALPGAQVEYTVNVVNVAAVPAFDHAITDDLAGALGQLSLVAGSATLNGGTAGVNVAGTLISADAFGTFGPLPPGGSAVLRFRATIASGLPAGTTITNTGVVIWNDPPDTASASVSFDVGGVPGVAAVNGQVWHDADFDDVLGGAERVLAGWTVELLSSGATLQSVVTDASGTYRIEGIAPNDAGGAPYALRFRAPDAGPLSASLGTARSPFTNGPQRIDDVVVGSGANLLGLDLPIDPNGVVYDALGRTPVAGATLTLLAAGSGLPLPASCFDDPVQQGQLTRADGFYKFDLNFGDAACPTAGTYLIAVAPPGGTFASGASRFIPPTSDATTLPLSVPSCPGTAADAVPAPPGFCEAQVSELAPPSSVPAGAGTAYHLHLLLDASGAPGTSQIFNNHIPVDPELGDAVGITKTTPLLNVTRGQLVPYEITIRNDLGSGIGDVTLVDRFPAGFRYVEGSARIDGVPTEPVRNGRELTWSGIPVDASGRTTVQLLLGVGGGVTEGEYVNRASAFETGSGVPLSGEATATVRVLPDVTFDCTDVFGKVYNDADRNGVQDPEEPGIGGVRVVTARGLVATTDRHGRYHITCAITPQEGRGSNFVLKLDDRSLPSGYRLSTRRTQVKRATRGKALRFNFAASIHRVVGLDLADAVFEPGSTAIRPHWRPRLTKLLAELEKAPSTLRLSYVADVEDAGLVEERLRAVQAEIADAWQARAGGYALTIEPEVFWHRGAPMAPPARRSDGR
jgi:uncharacterized repeat protein (TIGR01451 family)